MRQRHLITRKCQQKHLQTHTLPEWTIMNRRPPRTPSDPELSGCTDMLFPQWTAWRWSEGWSKRFGLLLHSQTCPHCLQHFSEAWMLLRMSDQPETSLSRWSTCKNNHYRWHASCRAEQDVVIPPAGPAKVWGLKYTSLIQLSTHPVITRHSVPSDNWVAVLFIPLALERTEKSHVEPFYQCFFQLSSCV